MLFFAKTREDPSVELSIINKCNDVLMVCSGGCSVLACIKRGTSIDCIDSSKEQISILQEKIQLINSSNTEAYEKSLMEIYKRGVFENLLSDLVSSNFDWDTLFNKKYLSTLFTDNATKHTIEFKEHFKRIFTKYHFEDPETNHFNSQAVHGRYGADKPLYYSNFENIRNYRSALCFINQELLTYLQTTNKKYDMIQISNIMDWICDTDRKEMVKHIKRVLRIGGFVVARRLNGDYCLGDYFDDSFELYRECVDKSYFYSEVSIFRLRLIS